MSKSFLYPGAYGAERAESDNEVREINLEHFAQQIALARHLCNDGTFTVLRTNDTEKRLTEREENGD